jgi:hypothetical protein
MNVSSLSFDGAPITRHDPLRSRVQAEFLEMPGLVLSLDQAARLFGIDAISCGDALTELVDSGLLTTSGGRFRRAS